MKVVGMLVVSRRGVNFGFWSHLGCSGQNTIIFSREGLVYSCTPKNIKIYILSVFQHGLFYGSKKAWAPPRSVSFRGLIQNFRRASPSLSYAESPPGVNNKIRRMGKW